jgi:hypothetical protein
VTLTVESTDAVDRSAPPPARPPLLRADVGDRLRRRLQQLRQAPLRSWVTFAVVAACVAWIAYTLHPDLLLTDTTATGGDMGSHVWGPMYLLRNVLPHGQLSGWSPDWYAGFPAYQFYMVVPSLLVVALHVGIRGPLLLPALVLALGVAASGYVLVPLERFRRLLVVGGLVATVLVVPIPYNVAFKLVTVAGLLTLPVAAWAFGRLSVLPFPTPALLAVGALLFLYNREPTLNGGTGNIIGGNMTSTMAGEFAFSISLSLCLVFLGLVLNGLRTGRRRAAAAVVLAACGLCHLIPAFFALLGGSIVLLLDLGHDLYARLRDPERPLGWSARLRWAAPVGVVAGLLSAFWVLPFLLRGAYVNDMGWEPLPHVGQSVWSDYLTNRALWGPLAVAAVGLVTSIVFRRRTGLLLAIAIVVVGALFILLPEGRLWNARVLPFYYLSLFLLAAIGVGEVFASLAVVLAPDPERPSDAIGAVVAPVLLLAALLAVALPMDLVPGTDRDASGAVGLGPLRTKNSNPVGSWAEWNYSGLERKPAVGAGSTIPTGEGGYPEYRALVQTMTELGRDPDHGCGRAFWEYSFDRLNSYGTPMTLMMLPYFTDSCIGSMEGLYFESSTTTPYHFLSQCMLSAQGSCAQRDLPYSGFDLERGIGQLQLLGVRYYLAVTPTAVGAAAADDRLTEVAVSGPWHVYEIADSPLVVGLDNEPAVVTNVDASQDSWLPMAVAWYGDPARRGLPLALAGPDRWQRVQVGRRDAAGGDGTDPRIGDDVALPDVETRPVDPVRVAEVRTTENEISFRVDEPGRPVLVKASYFPNWDASGADGPYRVTPNLMVVVPTEREVTLHYGRTAVDWAALALSLLGVAALVWLARRPPVKMPPPLVVPERPVDDDWPTVPPDVPHDG